LSHPSSGQCIVNPAELGIFTRVLSIILGLLQTSFTMSHLGITLFDLGRAAVWFGLNAEAFGVLPVPWCQSGDHPKDHICDTYNLLTVNSLHCYRDACVAHRHRRRRRLSASVPVPEVCHLLVKWQTGHYTDAWCTLYGGHLWFDTGVPCRRQTPVPPARWNMCSPAGLMSQVTPELQRSEKHTETHRHLVPLFSSLVIDALLAHFILLLLIITKSFCGLFSQMHIIKEPVFLSWDSQRHPNDN